MSESGAEIQIQTPSIGELSRQFVIFGKELAANYKIFFPDNVASKSAEQNAEKIMNGAFEANNELVKNVLFYNGLRHKENEDPESMITASERIEENRTDLSFEELIVLTALDKKIFIQGTSLTEQEVRDRLEHKIEEKIVALENSPTSQGELTRRKVTALDKFRKQLVDTTPSVSTDSL